MLMRAAPACALPCHAPAAAASWQIVAVSDARQRVGVDGTAAHAPDAAARWSGLAGTTKNTFLTKMGVDVGPLPVLLDVRVCTRHVRGADGSVRKEYGKDLVPYPLQVRRRDVLLRERAAARPMRGCRLLQHVMKRASKLTLLARFYHMLKQAAIAASCCC